MGYAFIPPDPDTLIAERGTTKLYAELAECPLYVNARIIGPGILGKRFSFRLGWIIEEKRWAFGGDVFRLPAALLEWAAEAVAEVYPDLATATGCTLEEIAEIKAEQTHKREVYKESKTSKLVP